MTLCSDTAKPPTQGPFQTFGRTKASVAILCRSDPPFTHTHTQAGRRASQELKKGCSTGPYAAEAAHLVAQPIVRPIPGASPSIFVSRGQIERERQRERESERGESRSEREREREKEREREGETLYDRVRERGTRLQLQDE